MYRRFAFSTFIRYPTSVTNDIIVAIHQTPKRANNLRCWVWSQVHIRGFASRFPTKTANPTIMNALPMAKESGQPPVFERRHEIPRVRK